VDARSVVEQADAGRCMTWSALFPDLLDPRTNKAFRGTLLSMSN
jgi:hypothetical protein